MGLNHFDILGIKPSPIINATELKRAFITKQRLVHPDTGDITDTSQELNAAYEILKTEDGPVKSFLLLHIAEDALNKNVLPSDFLMEMMELSDIIEESKLSEVGDDKKQADEILMRLKDDLEIEKHKLFSNLTVLENEISNDRPIYLDGWIVWYQKFRYYARLRKNLDGIVEL